MPNDRQLRWVNWTVIFAGTMCFGVLAAANIYLSAVAEGRRATWLYTLYRVEVFWLIYVALLPALFRFVERYPLNLQERSTILIHIAGATAFAYLHILLFSTTFLYSPSQFSPGASLGERFFRSIRLNFSIDFLTYWVILGGKYAFQYYRELQRRELAAAQLAASLTEARLRALQSQLNPHFFFNTLNAISVLALKRDHDSVMEMLGRLGELIRFCCDDHRPQLVSLGQELAFLEAYAEIQRLSFGDRLTIRVDVSPDLKDALVPSMILQPLIENAIVHGVSQQCGNGTVALKATRAEAVLCLEVSDTGPGFGTGETRRNRVGLANIEARLGLLYGPDHRIDYGDSASGGALVTLRIPFESRHITSFSVEQLSGRL